MRSDRLGRYYGQPAFPFVPGYDVVGAARRDRLHYALGTLLTVLAGVALMLPPLATMTVMAVVGGGAYVLAAALAHRHHSSQSSTVR